MALRELRVSNLAVLARAAVPAGPGFTAVSGETGAGKSVCVAALRAVAGERTDPDAVRAGASSAVVAAVFDDVPEEVRARLAGLGADDDELLTLTREIVRGGRGSCRVNGALVSLAVLREVGEQLLEVTAQGASHRLLRRDVQRDLLDDAAGEPAISGKNALSVALREWRAASARLEAARRAAASSEHELGVARDVVEDLERLSLRDGEEQALAAEALRLRHAAAIEEAAQRLATACGGDDSGAADMLAGAAAAAAGVAAVHEDVRELVAAAEDCVDRMRELRLDALRVAESGAVDDVRLAAVEERLDAIARVKRRHGSVEQALAALEHAREVLAAHDAGDQGLERLEQVTDAARISTGVAAAALRRVRSSAARQLARAVTAQLRELALPHARFTVSLSGTADPDGVDVDGDRLRCTAAGVDEVTFRLAANRDALPMPLDEGPSGGELSRLALAISAVVNVAGGPTLVLDEVDTGIAGHTAATVGDVLARIGGRRQVLAVTHRAEIAARAGAHLLVSKRQEPGGAVAEVRPVDGEERLQEVARLMSGRVTRAALARAGELMREGAEARDPGPSRALRTVARAR